MGQPSPALCNLGNAVPQSRVSEIQISLKQVEFGPSQRGGSLLLTAKITPLLTIFLGLRGTVRSEPMLRQRQPHSSLGLGHPLWGGALVLEPSEA